MFLDTSGLLCMLDQREQRHEEASTFFAAADHRFTHTGVVMELVALGQARGLARRAVLDLVSELHENGQSTVVHVDEKMYANARELLQLRLDKTWSLCDAISFLMMDERRVEEALTTDHHFEQAGFVRLLPS